MLKGNINVALIQKSLDNGLTKAENTALGHMIEDEEIIPIEIQGENASAMGFIGLDMAEKLSYNYEKLTAFIREILNDVTKEHSTGLYRFADNEDYLVYLDYGT